MTPKKLDIEVHPLTPDRWDDFEALFGAKGACGGCWCMTPVLTRREYEANKGAGNRRLQRKAVLAGETPGVLGYSAGRPFGWCAIGPREKYAQLASSRILAPVDDRAVWSITCLFLAKSYRRQGLSRHLVAGAVELARSRGARLIEAYGVVPKKDPVPEVFAYPGFAAVYEACGFREVARRSATRPILRKRVRSSG